MKIKPTGSKMLIKELEIKNYVTGGNIEVVQNDLCLGEIVEVSDEYFDVFKKGEKVLYQSGAGIRQFYNNESCLWIDCRPVNNAGDIIAKIVTD